MSSVTLAQIGCGYWGPNLLRNFSSHPDCHVKWVVDADHVRRDYVSSNFPRTSTTEHLSDAFDDPDVDAVIIATPARSHFQLARRALLANKHVFVEKPLAMSVSECDDLMVHAERGGRVLMVGHTFLYNPAVRYLKNLLDTGDLGKPVHVTMQRLNLGKVRSDVNAWWNLAPHDVSILLYIMNGELPCSVTAAGTAFTQPGIEDVVFATLTWPSRVCAHIHVSWLDPAKVRKMSLVCSKKMVVYDDVAEDKITILDRGVDRVPRAGDRMEYDSVENYKLHHRTGDVLIPHISYQEPLKIEAAHFIECIQTGQQPITNGAHARKVVRVLEAAQMSMDRNSELVRLDSPTISTHTLRVA